MVERIQEVSLNLQVGVLAGIEPLHEFDIRVILSLCAEVRQDIGERTVVIRKPNRLAVWFHNAARIEVLDRECPLQNRAALDIRTETIRIPVVVDVILEQDRRSARGGVNPLRLPSS